MKQFLLSIALLIAGSLSGQRPVTGWVGDSLSADPLPGATVLITGTTIGTTSDLDGRFELPYTGSFPVEIQVSYIGYEERAFTISGGDLAIRLVPNGAALNEVVVTARRSGESAQVTPIPVTVLGAKELDNAVTFNVNRVKEMVPSVQLYASNPRNTTLNVRGLGSTFGLTNDGIDPGVGFYVDGVYYARPAASSLDFIDVRQIEVLRGPQGTLFGKNATAGSFNIVTRKPTMSPSVTLEQSFGNYGFVQTKGSISGPLVADHLAARLSFTGTSREGTVYNQRTEKYINTLANQGVRGQLLFEPDSRTTLLLTGDYTRQRPDGYAQVYAGTVPTQRATYRQFPAIIEDLGYRLPSTNPFDRVVDHDTPWRSNQDMAGASLTATRQVGAGEFTSISAWRWWKWDSSNDRDFTGLSAIARSQAPSIHHQWSQELRYSGAIRPSLNGVVGLFAFYQRLRPDGAHILEAGPDQWRFVQDSENPLWQTPGLLDGLTQETYPAFNNLSTALFSQLSWDISERVTLTPGLRLNYDDKQVDFRQSVYGGLATSDPELLALQRRVFRPQQFSARIDNFNLSGQLSLQYAVHPNLRVFGNYAHAVKPVGLNLGGIPAEQDVPLLELAIVRPERVNHFEVGLKSEPTSGSILNFTAFFTAIDDYQTNVQSEQLGVTRGYLANADKVSVAGAELEATVERSRHLRTSVSVSYLDGRYVSFPNAPVPLEETGGESLKDISGERLPGVSKWTGSLSTEYFRTGKLLSWEGEWFASADTYARSGFSSSPSPSDYLNIAGYALVNARLGFRMPAGLTAFVWGRNITGTRYFEQLLPAGGNSGHYAAVLGDPATVGITLRYVHL
ncbi:TonB-dependent receptor [Lewinella sp. IMCC34191]|uniref:TonB-dependent receptor n=1 Tax=Lewinella sp. IMCC34191 TaxID=2259172 RepID=UPI000E220229|nr:TonB-dependent receptor [Lewinella sp. IMCC34191]